MSLIKKIHPREGETILRVIYRYTLTYFWKYTIGFAVLFASAFFMFRLFSWGLWGYGVFGIGIILGVYIIAKTYAYNRVNALVITDQRVVDIHRVSWLDEVISSVGHHDVLDVSARRKGLLQSIFNYGTVSIHTKNSQFALDIMKVRDPGEVQSVLVEIGDKYARNRSAGDASAVCRNFVKTIPDLSTSDLLVISAAINERLDAPPSKNAS